jgi:dTDP-4-amino-4,6-dideoxygalactose transaminase
MDNWQAYIASVQVSDIEAIIQTRRHQYAAYMTKLEGARGFALPPSDEQSAWACIRFPIRVHSDKLSFYKRAVKRGVDFAFSFTFIPYQDGFPRAKLLADTVLDVPFYTKLSDHELNHVVSVLRKIGREVALETQQPR